MISSFHVISPTKSEPIGWLIPWRFDRDLSGQIFPKKIHWCGRHLPKIRWLWWVVDMAVQICTKYDYERFKNCALNETYGAIKRPAMDSSRNVRTNRLGCATSWSMSICSGPSVNLVHWTMLWLPQDTGRDSPDVFQWHKKHQFWTRGIRTFFAISYNLSKEDQSWWFAPKESCGPLPTKDVGKLATYLGFVSFDWRFGRVVSWGCDFYVPQPWSSPHPMKITKQFFFRYFVAGLCWKFGC